MAGPDQIKETTITTVSVPDATYHPALAADPDRILLIIHNDGGVDFWLAINSTAPVAKATMVKYTGSERHVYFTTHVPIEDVYIYTDDGPVNFVIEYASR